MTKSKSTKTGERTQGTHSARVYTDGMLERSGVRVSFGPDRVYIGACEYPLHELKIEPRKITSLVAGREVAW